MLNLKKAMDAYKSVKAAKSDVDIARRFYADRPERIADAEKAEAEAKTTFTEVSVKLTEAIKDAEGRATVRTIDAADVCKSLLEIEQKLDISKKAMDGIKVAVDYHAQKFPNAYKHIPYSTQFSAEYKNGSWRLSGIAREETHSPGAAVTVAHTPESKAAILDRLTYFEI